DFEKILQAESETGNEETAGQELDSKEEAVSAPQEKPCIAQFMVMTGCDFETASKALYTYENWRQYLGEDQEVPELSDAQLQLQDEIHQGVRQGSLGSYGVRDDYTPPTFQEPETPGTIVPAFNVESGEAYGVGFIRQDGTACTTASFSNRELIEEHAVGFGLGTQALENFAKLVGGPEATWASLNLNEVRRNLPDYDAFVDQYGAESTWNAFTAQSESAEEGEDSTEEAAARAPAVHPALMRSALSTAIANPGL
ncbi:MAG: hypothetical protein ACOCWR_05950, partial [Oceanidesulfovibrio sp.]